MPLARKAAQRVNSPNAISAPSTSSSTPIGSQPSYTLVHEEVASFAGAGNRPSNLIDRLLQTPGTNTRAIAKGVCASVLGSATTLIQ